MQKVITKSSEKTQDFAEELSKDFRDGGIIALSGELGAGKTTFAQGFAKGLGIKDKIISPSFLIIRQYPVPGQINFFYHIDLYRLENIGPGSIGVDLKNLGLEEILNDPTNIILIEWAEKISWQELPKPKIIKMLKFQDGSREIRVN